MSVPVYSSSKKNWFHIQPRLERLRGTPLASCPVSPAAPLRPPVVLRRALRPCPGQLTKAEAHSTTKTHSFRLSMVRLLASGVPPRVQRSVVRLSGPHAEAAPLAAVRQETASARRRTRVSVLAGRGGRLPCVWLESSVERHRRQRDNNSLTSQRSRAREPSSKVPKSLLNAAKFSRQNKP